MKRLLILIATVSLLATSAYGWGRREHATVAKIAENHLTPKAKEMLHKYMHRRSIVYYSCYADDFQIRLPDPAVLAGLDLARDWSEELKKAEAER